MIDMQHRAILDVGVVPDPDAVDVPPQDRAEPNAAFLTDLDVTNHNSIRRNEAVR
jgi:hypothetical protein